jgi:hypothetical protein
MGSIFSTKGFFKVVSSPRLYFSRRQQKKEKDDKTDKNNFDIPDTSFGACCIYVLLFQEFISFFQEFILVWFERNPRKFLVMDGNLLS